MLGLVFNELLNVIEDSNGAEYLENLLQSGEISSGGAYTNVGNYDVDEMLFLVSELSISKKIKVSILLEKFGIHLSNVFYRKYPEFFKNKDFKEFLANLDSHIHSHVRGLYPGANPPRFTFREVSEFQFELHYQSKNSFESFAKGLLIGCANTFGEAIGIEIYNNSPGNSLFKIEVQNER
ncbi:MAG: heme NO-binding domain-containing protein [Bdellovibrionales bacterium]